MPDKLQVIALISGGKDSLYSMLHCLAHGHNVVALANLYPEQAQGEHIDDIESHMYQTIGSSVIPLYETALQIPLYRQPIHGHAANTSKSYRLNESDETESIIPLLTRVLRDHPSADALSTGAILSTYQRTRVESVALRLNLTPLSYLWQYPVLPPYVQSSLLQDMQGVGLDARLVKVASGGLGGEMLWRNVADQKTIEKLERAVARFRGSLGDLDGGGRVDGAVLGEGGEFETLAVDGPSALFCERIHVEDEDLKILTGEGGTAFVRVAHARCIRKDCHLPAEPGDAKDQQSLEKLRTPPLWDDEFADALQALKSESLSSISLEQAQVSQIVNSSAAAPLDESLTKLFQATSISTETKEKEQTLYISNVTCIATAAAIEANEIPQNRIQFETESIVSQVRENLRRYEMSAEHITSATILLRSMDSFAAVNKIYSCLFVAPNPPARVTVGIGDKMPNGSEVMMSFVADADSNTSRRKGLHVQSRSYWAPANIGPYSQAIAVPVPEHDTDVVYVAGQIPLVPSTMCLLATIDFREHAALSLQHMWRIGREMSVRWWVGGAITYIAACDEAEARERAIVIGQLWDLMHTDSTTVDKVNDTEEDEWDVGDAALYRPWAAYTGLKSTTASTGINEKTYRSPLPDWSCISLGQRDSLSGDPSGRSPPCIIVEVADLPRGAMVEWSSFGILGHLLDVELEKSDRFSVCKGGHFCVSWVEVMSEQDLSIILQRHENEETQQVGLLEIYTSSSRETSISTKSNAMLVPCRSVWNSRGHKLQAAVRWRGCNNHQITK